MLLERTQGNQVYDTLGMLAEQVVAAESQCYLMGRFYRAIFYLMEERELQVRNRGSQAVYTLAHLLHLLRMI